MTIRRVLIWYVAALIGVGAGGASGYHALARLHAQGAGTPTAQAQPAEMPAMAEAASPDGGTPDASPLLLPLPTPHAPAKHASPASHATKRASAGTAVAAHRPVRQVVAVRAAPPAPAPPSAPPRGQVAVYGPTGPSVRYYAYPAYAPGYGGYYVAYPRYRWYPAY